MTVTFNDGTGASVFQQQLYSEAILYLMKYDGMGQVLTALATTDLNINFIYNGNDSYSASTNTISWDPTSALNVVQANGQVGAQSAALGLFHEISHWLYAHTGNPLYAEFSATNFETQAAISLGEPIRPSYTAVNTLNPYVVINNPTAHSGGGYWQAIDVNGNPVVGGAYSPNSTIVSIAGGPTGATGTPAGGSTGSGAGGGEHGGTPGGGTGTTVGTGLGDTSGGGGSGGGHWQYPVQTQSVHIGPYDTVIVQNEQPVVIVGTPELSHT
jgi:hypothetical protein